jgi:hypothetical protein
MIGMFLQKMQRNRSAIIFTITCITAISISGCKEIHFPEPQPKGVGSLSGIPKRLQGYYEFPKDSAKADTLVITRNEIYPKNEYKDRLMLSDSLILKTYKGYYFFSNRSENLFKTWRVYIVRKSKNDDLVVMGLDDGKFDDFVLKLSKEIRIDSVANGNTKSYTIDPTPKQLIELIKKGYFIKLMECKKIK